MSEKIRVLHIVDWEKTFENFRTRRISGIPKWVSMPTRHDSSGFCELMDNPNGVAHYGCWCLLCQIAAKCTPRGYLIRTTGKAAKNAPGAEVDTGGIQLYPGGSPKVLSWIAAHDSCSLARQTRASEKLFSEAIPRLIDVGWLEFVELEVPAREASTDNGSQSGYKSIQSGARREPSRIQKYPYSTRGGTSYEVPLKKKKERGKERKSPPPRKKVFKTIKGAREARRASQGFSRERDKAAEGKTLAEVFAASINPPSDNSGKAPTYPSPQNVPLPKPLYPKTAETMLKAIDSQIESIRDIAKPFRTPITARTAEGTEYRSGWKLPVEALDAMAAWERRRKEIVSALAG